MNPQAEQPVASPAVSASEPKARIGETWSPPRTSPALSKATDAPQWKSYAESRLKNFHMR